MVAHERQAEIEQSQMLALKGSFRTSVVEGIPILSALEKHPVRAVSYSETYGQWLYNSDIQDIIKSEKVDVVGFDACLMAMLETGYAMRGGATILVGSEELEPAEGWDYSDWCQVLVNNPSISSADLSRLIVDSYGRTYANSDRTTTMSAIDLSKVNTLASSVSSLADELTNKLSQELTNIKKARQACQPFAPGYGLNGIDLGRFLDQLIANSHDPQIISKSKLTRAALQQVVVGNYAGALRQEPYGYGSFGLAIYFPESKTFYEADPDHLGYDKLNTDHPVEFVRNEHWSDFLHAYFEKVP